MSRRLHVCSTPGCPELTAKTHCPTHTSARRKASDAQRPNARQRGYDNRWERNREAFLQAFPLCADCGAPATVPDHDPITRAELVRQGVPDPDAWHRLVPRCASCHSRKTVKHDGGFGR